MRQAAGDPELGELFLDRVLAQALVERAEVHQIKGPVKFIFSERIRI
jgi:hypothetical protein